MITFFASDGRNAILQGVYQVNQLQIVNKLPDVLNPIIVPENWGEGPYYYYDLIKDNSLSDLKNRLVIDWGGSTVT